MGLAADAQSMVRDAAEQNSGVAHQLLGVDE